MDGEASVLCEDGQLRTLRDAARHTIDHQVKWIPSWGRDRIFNMVSNRPDWCISRQRAWGVPIPAVDCTKCREAILTTELIERAADIFEQHSADAWYERPIEEFLPPGLKCPSCGGTTFERERDILDVWFDSGSSHEAVLPRYEQLTWPSDMYLEGSDQHRGWFQSSLLVALATRGRPPFREVLTHGFLIDLEGRKMSKSLGNTIVPQEVIKESGADIIRLWVAMTEFTEELRVSKEILTRVVDLYRKLRNTCRILVANLYDFDPGTDRLPLDQLDAVDRFALARYGQAAARMLRAYDEYDFSTVSQTMNTLATVDLSAFYVDVTKDRMYTLGDRSRERRSTQTAMYLISEGLAKLLAPILPVTADDLWRHIPGPRSASVHLEDFPKVEGLVDAALLREWDELLEVREQVNAALEQKRKDKVIGTSLGARVVLRAQGDIATLLDRHRAELPMLFNVSEASLSVVSPTGDSAVEVEVEKATGVKCARCWRFVSSVRTEPEWAGICDRCVEALAA
jgi:isoleucyl-tRNA synthetase